MNFLREVFRKLSSDRQTDRHTNRIDRNHKPRHFAGNQVNSFCCRNPNGQLPLELYTLFAVWCQPDDWSLFNAPDITVFRQGSVDADSCYVLTNMWVH